jgi:hypothetical protein
MHSKTTRCAVLFPVLMGVLPAATGAGLMVRAWRQRKVRMAAGKEAAARSMAMPRTAEVVDFPKKAAPAPAGNTGFVPRLLARPVEVPMEEAPVFRAAVQPRAQATEKGPAAPIFAEEFLA